jgi:hypothetical protein
MVVLNAMPGKVNEIIICGNVGQSKNVYGLFQGWCVLIFILQYSGIPQSG